MPMYILAIDTVDFFITLRVSQILNQIKTLSPSEFPQLGLCKMPISELLFRKTQNLVKIQEVPNSTTRSTSDSSRSSIMFTKAISLTKVTSFQDMQLVQVTLPEQLKDLPSSTYITYKRQRCRMQSRRSLVATFKIWLDIAWHYQNNPS